MKFLILGAGLSGLSCAAGLKKYGHDVHIVDKAPEVGGLARTYRKDGFSFDYGPHFLFGPKVLDLIQKEFSSMALNAVASTKEKMFFHGKYFNFPFDPKNVLLNMERRKVPAVVLELMWKQFMGASASTARDVEEWVVQAVGRRIYDYISLGGYIEKLYGLPAPQISHEWGMQKLKFLANWRNAGLVTLAMKSFAERSNIKKRVIHYPPGGIDHIAGNIASHVEKSGARIFLNTEVQSVEHGKSGVTITAKNEGKDVEMQGDFLVSTVPLTHLVSMVTPAVPSRIHREVDRLRYRTLLLLYLFVDKDYALKDQCVYFTEKPYLFRRITEFKHMDTSMTMPGKTSLCLEMTCFDDDAILRRDKEELFNQVMDQLERGGYVRRKDVEDYQFLKVPFAYPVYEVGSGNILKEVLGYLQGFRNMVTIGRQGLFFYNAMNSSVLMGHALAEQLGQTSREGWAAIIQDTYDTRLGKYGENP